MTKEAEVIKMRDTTPEEEQKLVEDYIKSISRPTVVDFWDLEQEPCEDAISRQAALDTCLNIYFNGYKEKDLLHDIKNLPSVTPQPKTGHWLRMSDLSEQEDDRYRCSRCGNVVHYTNKMNLYTFNSWCGRCGSDNGRHINYEVEE